jgi:hypothetical protein
MLRSIFISLLLFSVSIPTFAKQIACEERGFVVEVPEDWEVKNPKFALAGPDKIVFTEINPSAESTGKPIGMLIAITTTLLKKGLMYKESGSRVDVPLRNARGSQQMFIDAAGRQVVQLIVEKNGYFWHFLLQVPMDVWNAKSQELLSIMRTVEVSEPTK